MLCLNVLSPEGLLFDVVNPAVSLGCICGAFCVCGNKAQNHELICDLTVKPSGRVPELWKGTVLTRHKSSAVLAEELNSIGEVN